MEMFPWLSGGWRGHVYEGEELRDGGGGGGGVRFSYFSYVSYFSYFSIEFFICFLTRNIGFA